MQHVIFQHTFLLYNRHLDQVMLSAIYGVCKVAQLKQISFKLIINHYRRQPQANSDIFRTVVLEQSEPELQVPTVSLCLLSAHCVSHHLLMDEGCTRALHLLARLLTHTLAHMHAHNLFLYWFMQSLFWQLHPIPTAAVTCCNKMCWKCWTQGTGMTALINAPIQKQWACSNTDVPFMRQFTKQTTAWHYTTLMPACLHLQPTQSGMHAPPNCHFTLQAEFSLS